MRWIVDAVFAFMFAAAVTAFAWNIEQEQRIEKLEKQQNELVIVFAAHYADSTNCVTKVYQDINQVRFSVKAIANSLKFARGK